MSENLLSSKLQIPVIRPGLVTRPRLLARLNEGLNRKMILVSAPAGFGKSTLLADWLRSIPLPAAWLSLDEDDNDLARFLTYLVAALQVLDPSLDNTALDLLKSPQPGLKKAALTALLNQIERIQTESVLVLDDYHCLQEADIHQAVDFLLTYLPPSLHLVISTRADPPLGLARLRAQGALLELRLADLRFSKQEALVFLSREILPPLTKREVSLLTTRTEGWIAGLQLAAISLRGKVDPGAFIRSFSGSNKYILDYLLEEVLQHQPPDVQHFLLQTSILERLNGDICVHLTGREDSRQLLADLERANLFLIPLDERRDGYRYHKLFRDLLNHRLALAMPEAVPALHRNASRWFEEHGWLTQAIDHALAAGEYKTAVGLIERAAEHTLMCSEVNTYQRWIARLPARFLEDNPSLAFYGAWARMLKASDVEDVHITAADLNDSRAPMAGRLDTLQAFALISRGEFSLAGETSEKALTRLPVDDRYFRGMAYYILSLSRIFRQDMLDTLESLTALSRREETRHNPMLKVMTLSQAAKASVHLGDLSRARGLYEEALEGARDRLGNTIPIAGEALMGLGDLLRELGELDQAGDLILEGIELTQQWRKGAAIEGYLHLSRVKQLQGDWPAANQVLERAIKMAEDYDVMTLDDRLAALWQARLWSFEGRLPELQEWVENHKVDRSLEALKDSSGLILEHYLHAREMTIYARYLQLAGEPRKALSLAAKLAATFEELGWADTLIEVYLLETTAHLTLGDGESARLSLEKALQLGSAGGYVGTFLEVGPVLDEPLSRFSGHPEYAGYAGALRQAFHRGESETETPRQPLVEPLSERELDVLGYLAGSLTTPEIAEEMFLSVNTVRTHIKNIYQKLGVHKRSAAVRRARLLDIL